MQLPEGWAGFGFRTQVWRRAEGTNEWRGTYCYGVVVLDVEVVIVVEIESIVVAVVLVGHAYQQPLGS